jgi:hypothetical protein
MKSFFLALLSAGINGAAKGASSASDAQAPLKSVGVAAGATALMGILAFLMTQPAAQHPAVAAAVASHPLTLPTAPAA